MDDTSLAGLELTHGSTWYLTKSKDELLQKLGSENSSLSFVSFSDSTLVFDSDLSLGDQTLYIGKKWVKNIEMMT
ncbi:hypothetical protein [Bartonella rattaustraliani]|uniref:hypothetical protein n=1 Tax=Bartonella rattaustraliani TaxID=481139 RepID=UPI0002E798D3|nr:hypothetical protein [Bartonella rattaustraliani]